MKFLGAGAAALLAFLLYLVLPAVRDPGFPVHFGRLFEQSDIRL